MLIGLAAMIYTGINRAWGAFVLGGLLLLVGLFAPRMKGPFSFGGPKLNFKGELTDPDGEQPTLAGAQPGRLLPPGPPEESRPPLGRPR